MEKIKKLFKVIIVLTVFTASHAQDIIEEKEIKPSFNISGTIDTYMRHNFSSDKIAAPATSFANLPGFALGMANLIISYEGEKSGFVADLVYGPRGAEAVFNSKGSSNLINQMYVYLNINQKAKISMGNFNTFLGYEMISPTSNFNYSTSYMFSFGPFSHTGIKVDYTLSKNSSLMVGILNPSDWTEDNRSYDDKGKLSSVGRYWLGLQLGFSGQYLNYLGGQGYSQIDFTGGFNLTESFFLGINATSATNIVSDGGFLGFALYPQLTLSDSFSLGLRGEIFSDKNDFIGVFGIKSGDAENASITLTGSYTSGNMILKPEIRIDSASEKIFIANTDASNNLASFVIAAIYSF